MSEFKLVSKNPIVAKIVSGEANREVLDMLLSRQLPFTEEEYLESLVFAMRNDAYKNGALELLKKIPDTNKQLYVERREANHRVVFYVLLEALSWKKESIIAKVIHNQALPPDFLVKIAQKGNPAMLEMLLENQIKLIAYPEVMTAMELNPDISNFILGRIKEIRDFYFDKDNAEDIPVEDVMDDLKETLTQEQETAAQEGENEDEEDLDSLEGLEEVEEKALTLLQEINGMSISERIKLAFSGTKTHRMVLIKDSNKMVSLSVVESPKLSIDEVTQIVKNKSLPSEIIAKVSRNREWTKNYPIVLELVQNPKTPVKDALTFIKKLHFRDLRALTRNKNINPVIRNLAVNFFAQKGGNK